MMKIRHYTRRIAASLVLTMMLAGAFSMCAQADVLDDAREMLAGVKDKVVGFLEQYGIAQTLKGGYDRVTDFMFTYETQPDDSDMEKLAQSWAVTAWLADEDKKETNIYYFDNHTYSMVEDLTEIGRGYNLKKTPSGSYLNGKYTGVLKATVTNATSYNVEWVNYDEELSMYLLSKMQESESESEPAQ